MKTKAKFIVFEGGEGVGKSTQAKLLHQRFLEKGQKAILTREPGGTKSAEQIRELLVNGSVDRWDAKTELLLHMAARNEHYLKVIKPALAEGMHVICDRFVFSSVAYQGYAQGLGEEFVLKMHEDFFGKLYPDITILLSLDVQKGLDRAKDRDDTKQRYEKMGTEFHNKIATAFEKIAREHFSEIKHIIANDTIENIQAQIWEIVNK
jgi:dTMP kinase